MEIKAKYLVVSAVIAIAVIGGVWATTWMMGRKPKGSATGFSFVKPVEWHLYHASGNLVIAVKAEEPMIIHSIEAGEGSLTDLEKNLAGGEKATFTIPATGITGNIGDSYTLEVEIVYLCLEEYEEEESVGTITGELE